MKAFEALWQKYLVTGGCLTAINNYESYDQTKISHAIYQTYIQWIFGDLIKHGKNPEYVKEIFQTLIEKMGSQITWNSLSQHLSIDHNQTVADYVSLLERMDVMFVLSAFREGKLKGAPKKAKKIHFTDPFEIKNTRSLRLKECKQIKKYKKGIIASQIDDIHLWEDLYLMPMCFLALLLS